MFTQTPPSSARRATRRAQPRTPATHPDGGPPAPRRPGLHTDRPSAGRRATNGAPSWRDNAPSSPIASSARPRSEKGAAHGRVVLARRARTEPTTQATARQTLDRSHVFGDGHQSAHDRERDGVAGVISAECSVLLAPAPVHDGGPGETVNLRHAPRGPSCQRVVLGRGSHRGGSLKTRELRDRATRVPRERLSSPPRTDPTSSRIRRQPGSRRSRHGELDEVDPGGHGASGTSGTAGCMVPELREPSRCVLARTIDRP